MGRVFRDILVILEVGGGFTGLTFATISVLQYKAGPPQTLILSILIALLFAFGIAAGIAMIERPGLGVPLSGIYQLLQIFHISSIPVTYSFFSGLQLLLGWRNEKPFIMIGHGGQFTARLGMPEQPWCLGINVVALILFVCLLCGAGEQGMMTPPHPHGGAPPLPPADLDEGINKERESTELKDAG